MNDLILADICNDASNYRDYSVKGENCFYKGDYIGKIKIETNRSERNITFFPVTPVESIKINLKTI